LIKRFLVADDNHTARRVIGEIISGREDWTVCAEAKDGMEALELALRHRPDLLVLDVQMPRMNGMEAAHHILEAMPGAPILLVSFHEAKLIMPDIKDTKVRGFVSKATLGMELLPAAEALLAGGSYFDETPGGPDGQPDKEN
jgi:DNA-binding NarL/FixJ family response regulator